MPLERTRRGKRRAFKRLLLRPWVILLLLVAIVPTGYYLFTGWRARDLAAKARNSFEKGNYRMSWLQLQSARDLRASDPEVLRVGALLETKFGRPEALETLAELESKGAMRQEDAEDRAKMAMRFGSEEEFEAAVQKLEAMGGSEDAVTLRAARAALRGDIDRAIAEARRAVEKSDSPEAKLELARLLGKRHGHMIQKYGRPAAEDLPALQEAAKIIDEVQGTTLAEPALALGLGMTAADNETKRRWAEMGMQNVSSSNPALLPAAEFLVRSGAVPADQMRNRLRAVYDTAPLDQRADFALWLARQGLPKDALSLVTAQEAADNMSAFLARTDALGKMGNWQAVFEAADAAEQVPESLRQLTRVWALVNLGDDAAKRQALTPAIQAAVQSAAREKQLGSMLDSLDAIGAGAAANTELERLCADPATADAAFALLRERIGRSAGTMALEPIYVRAKAAAPNAPAVLDYGRYLELFRTARVDPADTAEAIGSQPSEVSPRVTHALLMLRRNNAAASKAAFDDVTVFFDQMIPAHQVVVAAFTAGTGDLALARLMRTVIKTDVLTPGEMAVLDQWAPEEKQPGGL